LVVDCNSTKSKYNLLMPKTLGYMITWTTYGSWLQGDKRGFVKNGRTYPGRKRLADCNRQRLQKRPVKLSQRQRRTVEKAILEKAQQLNQEICAVYVAGRHVHIVAKYIPVGIENIVRVYKSASVVALRKVGLTGRIWTKGFDKRYCFDQRSLQERVRYVNSHNRRYACI